MARKNHKAAKKASSSLLMLLIIAAALLAFLPFRLTLATGTANATAICNTINTSASAVGGCGGLFALSGTHITVDALGLLLSNNVTQVTSTLNGLGLQLLGLKAQRVTVDIASKNNTVITGLLPPIGTTNPGPTGTGGNTLEIKLVMLSTTITGYNTPKNALVNAYGETNLQALNPALMISLDRVIVDIFIDPFTSIATYIVSADMTVYQGLALLLQTATL